MPQIKHIAIATNDAGKTAKFYSEVFGLRQVAELNGENAKGFMLSDGNVNVAILDFQNDAVAGERGKDWEGIHHIGFEVESLEDIERRLAAANSQPMDEVNQALHAGNTGPRHQNVETKYTGPNGEMIDVSQVGWVGTRGLD
jgi:methylmalonyl-CoA/ethylmalonyl-CoA epimerase